LNQDWLLEGQFGSYSAITIETKERNGTFINPNYQIALKDTGDFWNAFQIYIIGNELILDSTDSKTKMLIDEYTDNIFNIPEKNKDDVTAQFTEILLTKINNVLQNA
jgi:hypothetical protein